MRTNSHYARSCQQMHALFTRPILRESGKLTGFPMRPQTTVDRSTGRTTTTKVDVVDVEAIDVDGRDV